MVGERGSRVVVITFDVMNVMVLILIPVAVKVATAGVRGGLGGLVVCGLAMWWSRGMMVVVCCSLRHVCGGAVA